MLETINLNPNKNIKGLIQFNIYKNNKLIKKEVENIVLNQAQLFFMNLISAITQQQVDEYKINKLLIGNANKTLDNLRECEDIQLDTNRTSLINKIGSIAIENRENDIKIIEDYEYDGVKYIAIEYNFLINESDLVDDENDTAVLCEWGLANDNEDKLFTYKKHLILKDNTLKIEVKYYLLLKKNDQN